MAVVINMCAFRATPALDDSDVANAILATWSNIPPLFRRCSSSFNNTAAYSKPPPISIYTTDASSFTYPCGNSGDQCINIDQTRRRTRVTPTAGPLEALRLRRAYCTYYNGGSGNAGYSWCEDLRAFWRRPNVGKQGKVEEGT